MNISLIKPQSVQQLYQNKCTFLLGYITRTIPAVQINLKYWRSKAAVIPDEMLRKQALDSITTKAFHCQGGAVFAAVPFNNELLRFIVAYQTICDYLDNLCDRAGSTDGRAFELLHQSLLHALDLEGAAIDYYQLYPYKNDGGYLSDLIKACHQLLQQIPAYQLIKDQLIILANWYSQLQVAKHLDLSQREEVLIKWAGDHLNQYPELLWQEFAAASGSTLAIFALIRQAFLTEPDLGNQDKLLDSYFPWICSLHIMLDYMIDQTEDRIGGDLNFTFYYDSQEEMMERLSYLLEQSYKQCRFLPDTAFHEMVIDGLLAMYMSDRKIEQQKYETLRTCLLDQGSPATWRTYHLCRLVRSVL